MNLKRFIIVLISLVILVFLSACSKEHGDELKGKSFEIIEDSGDVLGDIKFEDDGEYRIKDRDPFGGEGVGKYKTFIKDKNEYFIFASKPENAGEYLEDSAMFDAYDHNEYIWLMDGKKLKGFEYDGSEDFYDALADIKDIDKNKVELTGEVYEFKPK